MLLGPREPAGSDRPFVAHPDRIRTELERILASPHFTRSLQASRFLRYVVEKALAGEAGEIKERVIAVDVFGREPDYDPKTEPIVRTEARRLRRKLTDFYTAAGAAGGVRIAIPTGGYAPEFEIVDGQEPQSPAPPVPTRRNPGRLILGLAALAAAAVVLVAFFPRVDHREPARLVFLTTMSGFQARPSLSPDGSQVAFAYRKADQPTTNIYIAMTSGGALRQLTDGGQDTDPAWSPDGSQIAFRRGEDVMVVPPLGGAPRKVAESGHWLMAWSADSRWIAIGTHDPHSATLHVELVSPETGEQRRLTNVPDGAPGDIDTAFSPDGVRYAVFRQLNDGGAIFIGRLDREGMHRRTPDSAVIGLTWAPDGDHIIYASNREGLYSLWQLDASGNGDPVRLSGGGPPATFPTAVRGASAKTWRVVYEERTLDINLWTLNLADPHARAVKIVDSTRTESSPSFSPDGRHIVYVSDRLGGEDLWLAAADGSAERQLTRLHGVGSPKWSPDGRLIAFDRVVEAGRAIHVVEVDTGAVRLIVPAAFNQGRPTWSGDSRYLYYFAPASPGSRVREIWKTAVTGRPAPEPPVRVTSGGGFEGFESSDGQYFYYLRGPYDHTVWRMPANGGTPVQLLTGVAHGYWRVAPHGIYYIPADVMGATEKRVLFYDFKGSQTLLTTLLGQFFTSRPDFDIDPAGKQLAWAQIDSAHTNLRMLDLQP